MGAMAPWLMRVWVMGVSVRWAEKTECHNCRTVPLSSTLLSVVALDNR